MIAADTYFNRGADISLYPGAPVFNSWMILCNSISVTRDNIFYCWICRPIYCKGFNATSRAFLARLTLVLTQETGLDAWASRVKCPARFVSRLHEICIYRSCLKLLFVLLFVHYCNGLVCVAYCVGKWQGWSQFNSGIGIAAQFPFQFRNWNWNWNWWNWKWNWNWKLWNWNWKSWKYFICNCYHSIY